MEMDDDAMIIIVADDSETTQSEDTSNIYNDLTNITIKQEKVDYDDMNLEELLELAEHTGIRIKTESDLEYNCEYLEDEFQQQSPVPREEYDDQNDPAYKPDVQEDEADSNESIVDSDEYINNLERTEKQAKYKINRRTKWRIKDPALWVSQVQKLRDINPELRDDQQSLVKAVATLMQAVKPPTLPSGFYKILSNTEFQCTVCEAVHSTLPACERHYQAHHGERYLICFSCGADFRSTTNLYKHEKRCLAPDANIVLRARALSIGGKGRNRPYLPHRSPRPKKSSYVNRGKRFHCRLCPAEFVVKTSLVAHERMHRAERPFQCDLCPSAYTSKSVLIKHMTSHSDISFICDHCGRTFKQKTTLVSHMYTHCDVPRFACPECPRRYTYKAALHLHVHRKHRNLPLPCACQICPKRFGRMWALKDHMKKAHGMLLMTRTMFFKQLPMMSETEIKEAKVVLKSEVPILFPSDINIDQPPPSPEIEDNEYDFNEQFKEGQCEEVNAESDDQEDEPEDKYVIEYDGEGEEVGEGEGDDETKNVQYLYLENGEYKQLTEEQLQGLNKDNIYMIAENED